VNAGWRDSGLPTGPEVDKLIAKHPITVMVPGYTVPYTEAVNILKLDKRSQRYSTVVSAWRKRLYEQYNIFIGVSRGEGYVVLDGSGRVDTASRRVKQSVKRVVKAGTLARNTDRTALTPGELRIKEHLENMAGGIETLVATARKKLSYEIKSLSQQ